MKKRNLARVVAHTQREIDKRRKMANRMRDEITIPVTLPREEAKLILVATRMSGEGQSVSAQLSGLAFVFACRLARRAMRRRGKNRPKQMLESFRQYAEWAKENGIR